jgi:peptide deformylase
MAILEILKIGHPTLARKADRVTAIDEGLVRLARDMVETLHAAPGIGLAAPQVDVSRRLIVVDLSPRKARLSARKAACPSPTSTKRSPGHTGSGSRAWTSKAERRPSRERTC